MSSQGGRVRVFVLAELDRDGTAISSLASRSHSASGPSHARQSAPSGIPACRRGVEMRGARAIHSPVWRFRSLDTILASPECGCFAHLRRCSGRAGSTA